MAKKRKQSFNKFDQKKKRKVEEVNAENQEEVKEPTLEEIQPVSKVLNLFFDQMLKVKTDLLYVILCFIF